MPSRCIFFFSALRAWSTLLSRTRTCTHPPCQCAEVSALGGNGKGVWARSLRHLGALSTRGADESPPLPEGASKDDGADGLQAVGPHRLAQSFSGSAFKPACP